MLLNKAKVLNRRSYFSKLFLVSNSATVSRHELQYTSVSDSSAVVRPNSTLACVKQFADAKNDRFLNL